MNWCHIYYTTSVILCIYSGYATSSEYYVYAPPYGEPCPPIDLPCNNLSFYVADYMSFFADDTIFYFLEGTHTLQGTLNISNVSNVTLQGLGHIEQGFHETTIKSTSIIACNDNNNRAGIAFISSRGVAMKSLTLANCAFNLNSYYNVSLFFVDINNATLDWVSVQNGSGYGLFLYNAFDVLITNSSFANNGALKSYGGNVLILYNNHLERMFRVSIVKSNFTLGLGAGMVLLCYNEAKIIIKNSTFSHNIAWYEGVIETGLYEGRSIEFNNNMYNNGLKHDGGGVYIESYWNSIIEFSNCNIYNNTAKHNGGGAYIRSYGNGSIEFSNCIVYNNTAKNNGGGIYIRSYGSGSLEFSKCTMYNNSPKHDGGGVYIRLYGNGNLKFSNCTMYNNTPTHDGGGVHIRLHGNGSVEFSNCIIYNNTAQYDGGGVYICSYDGYGSVEFCNSTIYSNVAQYDGGGVYICSYSGCSSIKVCNCTIYNNSAYGGSGLCVLASQATSKTSFHFTNVIFRFNKPTNKLDKLQSAIRLLNTDNVTFDQIEVNNHNTTGLVGFNCQLTFDKYNVFVNNSGIYGGGIALYESSQLLIKQQANISFVNNYASESGGGIFVSQVFVDFITDCSFKVIPSHSPYNSSVLYFVSNAAGISGDVLYGGKINDCLDTLNFDILFHYPTQTGLSAVSSDPIQVCFCESDRQNCSVSSINIMAMPGIDVNISLATVGIKDGLTDGVMKLVTSESLCNVQTAKNRLNASCTNVTFKVYTNPESINTTEVVVTLENSIKPLSDPRAKAVKVSIGSCPTGFPLINDRCVCRSELNTPSVHCDVNTQTITRDGDMWIGYVNDSDCFIVYSNCPFDYCNSSNISFIFDYPTKQCLLNRSGILCGQCAEGLSLVLGSNQCGQCNNDYLALIIPFAVAAIALVAFVIVLNLTVSVGTINGLIFYANVVKIYEPIFFPDGPITYLSQFISWLNLDLGIETCFFDGMDSCSKAWLQFIFPAYIWFILILIIILSQYFSKVVRLVGRQSIPVLATMILLSYTKLIRTVFQVLHHTNIQCDGNNSVTLLRWYIDANVQYLTGCHLPLFLFSLAVLILLIVPYTFYLLTIPLFEGPLLKYMRCCQKLSTYMKPFFDAYGGPYKDNCRFWTGFLLLIRVALALVVSLDTKATISLDVLTSLLTVIISMYFLLKGIYRHLPLACLEMLFFLNLMLMAYMNIQTCEKSQSRQISSIALVSVSFVVFCTIIFYHVWDRLLKSRLQQPITEIKKIFKKPMPCPITDGTESPLMRPGSPAFVCETSSVSVVSLAMRRESLLFDDD